MSAEAGDEGETRAVEDGWHAAPAESVLDALSSSAQGLSGEEARRVSRASARTGCPSLPVAAL